MSKLEEEQEKLIEEQERLTGKLTEEQRKLIEDLDSIDKLQEGLSIINSINRKKREAIVNNFIDLYSKNPENIDFGHNFKLSLIILLKTLCDKL